jgi:hypothetical protein
MAKNSVNNFPAVKWLANSKKQCGGSTFYFNNLLAYTFSIAFIIFYAQ